MLLCYDTFEYNFRFTVLYTLVVVPSWRRRLFSKELPTILSTFKNFFFVNFWGFVEFLERNPRYYDELST